MDKSSILLGALIFGTILFFVVAQKYQSGHVHSESCCHGHMHHVLQ